MSITRYSVVQFVPNVVAGERINLAVLAFSEAGELTVKAIRSWDRIRQFAGRNVADLQAFVRDLESGTCARVSLEQIIQSADCWHHLIQFTDPQPSTLEPADVLAQLGPRFLPELAPKVAEVDRPHYRTRSAAIHVAYKALHYAFAAVGQKNVLRKKIPHSGLRGQHQFDLGALNGAVYLLGQAVSFENPDEEKVSKDVDAASWRFRDVRDIDESLTLAVFALVPPRVKSQPRLPLLDQAQRNFEDLDVEIVTEEKLPEWSRDIADRIASEAP